MNHLQRSQLLCILENSSNQSWENDLINFISHNTMFYYEDCINEIQQAIKTRAYKKDSVGMRNILKLTAHLCSSSSYQGMHVSEPIEDALRYSIFVNNKFFVNYILNAELAAELREKCPPNALVANPWDKNFNHQKNLLKPAILARNLQQFDIIHDFYKKKAIPIPEASIMAATLLSNDNELIRKVQQKLQLDYATKSEDFFRTIFSKISQGRNPVAMQAFTQAMQERIGPHQPDSYKFLQSFVMHTDSVMNKEHFCQLVSHIPVLAKVYMEFKMSHQETLTSKDLHKISFSLFTCPQTALGLISHFIVKPDVSIQSLLVIRNNYIHYMRREKNFTSLEPLKKICTTIDMNASPNSTVHDALELFKAIPQYVENIKLSSSQNLKP